MKHWEKRHCPPDFWENQSASLMLSLALWGTLCSCSLKTGRVLPKGSAWCKPKKEIFPALSRGHVVKGFGSDRLRSVGAACVRASFIAVEIWCGEWMHMRLYISPPFRLKCIQTTWPNWELHYAAQGNTSSLRLHGGFLCLSGFFLSLFIARCSDWLGMHLFGPWRTTGTEQHASSHQKISPARSAARLAFTVGTQWTIYFPLATMTLKELFPTFLYHIIFNKKDLTYISCTDPWRYHVHFQDSYYTGQCQGEISNRVTKGINIFTPKAHLGVWMDQSLQLKALWALCEHAQ